MQYSYTEANMAELSNYQGALNDIWRDGWPTLPVYREDGTLQCHKTIQGYLLFW